MRQARPKVFGVQLFSAAVGLFLATALMQWGAAVILDDPAFKSAGLTDPLGFGGATNIRYWGMAALALAGCGLADWKTAAPRWLLILPLVWLTWQIFSSAQTADSGLTQAALKHFAACVLFYYLGLLVLSRVGAPLAMESIILAGLLASIWVGFGQHYGGLEATREFYLKLHQEQLAPDVQKQFDTVEFERLYNRPDFQKRLVSDRVFGTLMYPNSFAGAILLLLPISLVAAGQILARAPFLVSGSLLGLFFYGGAAALYWSGSKAGWLIALGMLALGSWRFRERIAERLSVSRKFIVIALVVLGAAGIALFFVKFSNYFSHGAPSVGSRMEYWTAAWHGSIDRPFLGSGPGTFAIVHERFKDPEAEMARLTHNDYLEQATDSGWIGCVAYSAWIVGGLVFLWRRPLGGRRLAMTLGCAAFAAQSFVDFGLYVPALAWPFFTMFGWLAGAVSRGEDSRAARG